jgi:hypothetical protein
MTTGRDRSTPSLEPPRSDRGAGLGDEEPPRSDGGAGLGDEQLTTPSASATRSPPTRILDIITH